MRTFLSILLGIAWEFPRPSCPIALHLALYLLNTWICCPTWRWLWIHGNSSQSSKVLRGLVANSALLASNETLGFLSWLINYPFLVWSDWETFGDCDLVDKVPGEFDTSCILLTFSFLCGKLFLWDLNFDLSTFTFWKLNVCFVIGFKLILSKINLN